MQLPVFEVHKPGSLAEVLELKSDLAADCRLLAGGTDLIVNMKKGLVSPGHLIDLSGVDAMRTIREEEGQIVIGACVTVSELAESERIGTRLSALKAGALALGSALIRNRATIGGNINSARPAADLLPPLIAYQATLVLESRQGRRSVSLESFILGPGKTAILPDEVMTEVRVPVPLKRSGAGYVQLGKRRSQEINIVNVASYLTLARDGRVDVCRIVLGSVGPTPLRAVSAEAVLTGSLPDEALFFEAGEAARQKDCRPIDDFRGTADYRRAMTGVLTKRTLSLALAQAGRA